MHLMALGAFDMQVTNGRGVQWCLNAPYGAFVLSNAGITGQE